MEYSLNAIVAYFYGPVYSHSARRGKIPLHIIVLHFAGDYTFLALCFLQWREGTQIFDDQRLCCTIDGWIVKQISQHLIISFPADVKKV